MNSKVNKLGAKWTRPTWRRSQAIFKAGKIFALTLVIACLTNVAAKAADLETDNASSSNPEIKNACVTNTAQAAGGLSISLVDNNDSNTFNLVPGETIEKSPKILNNSDFDAWVFMRVKIPCMNVRAIEENVVSDFRMQQLFTYVADAANWKQLEEKQSQVEGINYIERLFVYNNKLESKASTGSLFSELTMTNAVGADLQAIDSLNVKISAHGIQASAIDNPSEAWRAYEEQISAATDKE